MTRYERKFEELVDLLEQYSPQEGVNYTESANLGTIKSSVPISRTPTVDLPVIMIVAKGKKVIYVEDRVYHVNGGDVLIRFYPIAVDAEIVDASPENPLLGAGLGIDLGRLSEVLTRINRIDGDVAKPAASNPSGIFTIPLSETLLDLFIRLFNLQSSPRDVAMLAKSVMDEIYYRLLCDERGGELRYLLQQRGEIQRISKAVEYIHQNLDKHISVEQLAGTVHMGQTTFYENFKNVMHLSPLQYAKSVKLFEAQKLIKEGKNVNEAGHLVGYNSPAQFSREYKRHFGFAPSATKETSFVDPQH